MLTAALLWATAVAAHAGVVAPVRLPVVPSAPFSAASGLALPGSPAPVPALPALPAYLTVADPADRAWLAEVVSEARKSPTGRRVLVAAERALAARDRPLVVEVAAMEESGTYNYDWGVLSLRRRDQAEGARANAPTLIHELLHLIQSDRPLPSDLIETELEAYLADFRVHRELGLTPKRGSYDDRAQRAFRRGVEPFMRFLAAQYPEDAALWRTRTKDYEARLRAGLVLSRADLKNLAADRAEKRAVLERMRAVGQPRRERRAYREDALAPLDAALEETRRAIAWAVADLAALANPESRAAARRYARSVIRRARYYQRSLAKAAR